MAMAFAAAFEPRLSQRLRDSLFDAYQRLHPRPNRAMPVRIVDIPN